MAMYSQSTVDDWSRTLASLPLPEAAVVIDVRQRSEENLLLAHLRTELADLQAEMRHHHVPGWSSLTECMTALQVDATSAIGSEDGVPHPPYAAPWQERDVQPLYAPPPEESDFVVIAQADKKVSLAGRENLAKFLGMEVIDEVRTCRIKATTTSSFDDEPTIVDMGGTRLSTVRVFFLVDMEEPASVTRAATYARWFKAWTEQERGQKRTHRGDLIHTIVICMNAGASYYDVLLQTLGQLPDDATDTVILLQKYSDEEAAFKEKEQLAQVELLVYTLLLRWPDVFWRRIDDPLEMRDNVVRVAKTLPWPTFMIGISSFEYSAHWSARWLDFGVAGKLLAVLNDAREGEADQQRLKANIKKWLDSWWRDLRAIVPDALDAEIDELQAINHLRGLAGSSPVARSTALTALQNLSAFRQQVGACYTGSGAASTQQALDSSPAAILAHMKWVRDQSGNPSEDESTALEESSRQLIALYEKVGHFLGQHFQGARGAIPRGIGQLSALTGSMQTILEMAHRPIDLQQYNAQIEQQIGQAEDMLAKHLKLWRLPLVGQVLRSTIVSWLVVLVIGAFLLTGAVWQPVLLHLLHGQPFLALYTSGIVWGVRVLLLLLLFVCERYYLTARNRALRRLYRQVDSKLYSRLHEHLKALGDVIGARVALDILREHDLYAPGKHASPYEQRLRNLEQLSKRVREQALFQQELADTRLAANIQMPPGQTGWNAYDMPSDLHARKESIAWSQIEDAFLQSCKELTADLDAVNLLAEMLLRRLGTESPATVLEDMWRQQRWLAGKGSDARFQAISTLMVVLLLSSGVVRSEIMDILPLLQEYVALRAVYQDERAVASDEALDLQATVREMMLAQARGKQVAAVLHVREKQTPAVLVSWVNSQRQEMPQLRQVFASNDMLEHLEEISGKLQPSQVVDDLRKRGALLGYPDELSGEDRMYLFVAPGLAGEAFLQALDPIQHAQVRRERFPDREKLVYLHIHQIRQLLPSADQQTMESKQH